jgi:type IV pilus assembly protein PilW
MTAAPSPQRGISLIELLVSLVIGLVVIGVTFANYLNSGSGHNSSAALSQISEDASVALNLIRKQVALAGYSTPYQINTTTGLERTYKGQAIFGCNQTFDDTKKATIGDLTCTAATADTPDSIAVAYQADTENSILTAAGTPRDCVGTGLAQTATSGAIPAYYLSESRLYVNDNTLMCQGNGQGSAPIAGGVNLTGAPMPLVDNIVDMRILYGLSKTESIDPLHSGTPTDVAGRTPQQYVDAASVTAWNNVVAVRVCIVVRSESEVMDVATPYYGCDAVDATTPAATTPTDRRLYRAFSTTIMVQNRLGG